MIARSVVIVHEAVTNVVKHAKARGVNVSVAFGRKLLRLSVGDDGRGLTLPGRTRSGADDFGLTGMREHAVSIGAAFQVSSAGKGTILKVDIPLAS